MASPADPASSPPPGSTGAAGFKSRRGRPSVSQVSAIDAAIVRTARGLFLENGYASTSMEAVASSVGVSKGTLYARYPNKADLFKAIVSERLAAWSGAPGGAPIVEEESITDLMVRAGVGFLEAIRAPEVEAFSRLITSEAARFPELFQEFNDQGYLPFVDQLADRIGATARRTGWQVRDGRTVAASFVSALQGWFGVASLLDKPTIEEVRAFVERLVAIMIGGTKSW